MKVGIMKMMSRKEVGMIVSLLLVVLFTILPMFVDDPGIQWDFGLMTGLCFGIFAKLGDELDD